MYLGRLVGPKRMTQPLSWVSVGPHWRMAMHSSKNTRIVQVSAGPRFSEFFGKSMAPGCKWHSVYCR